MRSLVSILAMCAVSSAPAFAVGGGANWNTGFQPTFNTQQYGNQGPTALDGSRGSVVAQSSGTTQRTPQRTRERPVDHGPFTPEANRAYQGGGMVLQGAPGAPPPTPEPTPPGQTPRNMVPVR